MAGDVYTLDKLTVILNGAYKVEKLADDNPIEFEDDSDRFEVLGLATDGSKDRLKRTKKGGVMTLKILSSSRTANIIEDLDKAGEKINIQIQDDNTGGISYACTGGVLMTKPRLTIGKLKSYVFDFEHIMEQ